MRLSRAPVFTIVGLLTLGLFLLLEFLDPATRDGGVWPAVMQLERLLIIPIWLMRYVVVSIGIWIFGPDKGFPVWFDVATIPVLLLPYIMLDILLHLGRMPPRRSPSNR